MADGIGHAGLRKVPGQTMALLIHVRERKLKTQNKSLQMDTFLIS